MLDTPTLPATKTMSGVSARLRLVDERKDDGVWSSFAVGYDQAWAYYDDDKLKECISECYDLLDHGSTIPRYIRIATLILLCLVVKHKADFDEARAEARMFITRQWEASSQLVGSQQSLILLELLYDMTKSFHPDGEDEEIDDALEDLRHELNQLHAMEHTTEWPKPEEEQEQDKDDDKDRLQLPSVVSREDDDDKDRLQLPVRENNPIVYMISSCVLALANTSGIGDWIQHGGLRKDVSTDHTWSLQTHQGGGAPGAERRDQAAALRRAPSPSRGRRRVPPPSRGRAQEAEAGGERRDQVDVSCVRGRILGERVMIVSIGGEAVFRIELGVTEHSMR